MFRNMVAMLLKPSLPVFFGLCSVLYFIQPFPVLASSAAMPHILVEALTPVLSNRTYAASANPGNVPYTMGAVIVFEQGDFNPSQDLYMGIISPGQETTYYWRMEADTPVLKKGIAPLIEDLQFQEPGHYDTAALVGQMKFVISGNEEPGMYTIFALLIKADTDPAQVANWIATGMSPLFIK